jgi:hypothetical protein
MLILSQTMVPPILPHEITTGTSAASPHVLDVSMTPQRPQRFTLIVIIYFGNFARPAIRYIDCGWRRRGEDLGTVPLPFD